ncbi:hypothetical protein SNE40_011822 [Patella caerulea]|uniref:Transcriptional coactivator p15 (PC4) C-terminal domain-containing protein n=1 Tax=Patella caerulea TaxID=87958 RepID=A0AAN8JMN7_PATCE
MSNDLYRKDIGNDYLVVKCIWQEDVCYHLRLYGYGFKGDRYPTPNGIMFFEQQWQTLMNTVSEIDEYLQKNIVKKSVPIGNDVYVTIDNKYPGVNIRKFWWCEEERMPKPTRKGVHLNLKQWEALKVSFKELCENNFTCEEPPLGVVGLAKAETCV